jgi:hypothetical protein
MIVDAIHNGGRFCDSSRSEIKDALQFYGCSFRYHPVWKHASSCSPHEALLRRLALSVGVPVEIVSSRGGYMDVSQFYEELDGWMAWYSVIRRRNDIRRRYALLRACELFGDHRDAHPSEEVSPHNEDCIVGVSTLAAICDADRTVRVAVVSEALLANQKLGTLPKGTL